MRNSSAIFSGDSEVERGWLFEATFLKCHFANIQFSHFPRGAGLLAKYQGWKEAQKVSGKQHITNKKEEGA